MMRDPVLFCLQEAAESGVSALKVEEDSDIWTKHSVLILTAASG